MKENLLNRVSPWKEHYGDLPEHLEPARDTVLELVRDGMAASADRPMLRYFDASLTGGEIDEASDALACELLDAGITAGDRVVLQLQNMPAATVGAIGVWKIGAIAVMANPMYRSRELRHIMVDSGARAIIALAGAWDGVVAPAIDGLNLAHRIAANGRDYLQPGAHAPILDGVGLTCEAEVRLWADLMEDRRGQRPPQDLGVGGEDVAALVYTSGTTGPPKGAMILHRNIAFAVALWTQWLGLGPEHVSFGVAPVAHITGLVCCVALPTALGAQVLMPYRFEPGAAIEAIERHRASFMVGAITAYSALMADPSFGSADLSCLSVAFSGGAPVAPAIAERWRGSTGVTIRNCYGMTETTTATHITPRHASERIDPRSGALSIGIPVSSTDAAIVDDHGRPAAPGEIGHLILSGPQLCAGYWRNPSETENAFSDGWLKTGDIGFMDPEGWFYLVDRSKDLIIASGYKIWPREVEDVLVSHEAVREAAVVGVPDEYRGEVPHAFVSLRPSQTTTDQELIAFCRERLAAYKVPRQIITLDELPKTASGKILRRALRSK